MPKLHKYSLVFYIFCLALISPAKILANTDPVSATSSATATVPAASGTTGDTTAPSSPILVSPVDGNHSGDDTPEFIWRQSSDQNSNTVTYNFYLNGVATYLGISNIGNSAGSGYTARVDGNEIKLLPTNGYSDGQYNWYVTASDNSGNTAFSTTWSFTIDTSSPNITITDIDVYHNLNLSSNSPENIVGANFDIDGPKDVYFTIHTESWSTITLQIVGEDSLPLNSTWTVSESGVVYPFRHLVPGKYLVHISSFDQGGNTTALPEFTLTIKQATLTITTPSLPGSSPTTIVAIPYSPLSLPSLPATIANVTTRLSLSTLYIILLAIIVSTLIIFVWKRKINLKLINDKGEPISDAKLYHSIPNRKSPRTQILVTSKEPISFDLKPSNLGKLYIPHLSHYSTLTIRTSNTTVVLSICRSDSLYTIVL